MSEKLDGVRAYWYGERLLSRGGIQLHAPEWFTAQWPTDYTLDGELWLGRQQFQKTVGIVRRKHGGEAWRSVLFMVFDVPDMPAPFESRMEWLRFEFGERDYAVPLEHETCYDVDHLRDRLRLVEAMGGEGLMLRQPGSRYETGRSPTLLKVKTFHDAEAQVLELLPGTGRNAGRMGALLVQFGAGVRFVVGSGITDEERASPPANRRSAAG